MDAWRRRKNKRGERGDTRAGPPCGFCAAETFLFSVRPCLPRPRPKPSPHLARRPRPGRPRRWRGRRPASLLRAVRGRARVCLGGRKNGGVCDGQHARLLFLQPRALFFILLQHGRARARAQLHTHITPAHPPTHHARPPTHTYGQQQQQHRAQDNLSTRTCARRPPRRGVTQTERKKKKRGSTSVVAPPASRGAAAVTGLGHLAHEWVAGQGAPT